MVHIMAASTFASLSCTSGFITLNNSNYNFNDIEAGSMEEAAFSLTVSTKAPIGTCR